MKQRCPLTCPGLAWILFMTLTFALIWMPASAMAGSQAFEGKVFNPGHLPPTDSKLRVAPGEIAPDFTLPAVSGSRVTLSQYRGRKNVLLSFVPAAWTPVCSDQWPGYNIARPIFDKHDTVLIGITTDNIPTLFAWTQAMGGLWFDVVSDFWPHGRVADRYGVLRTDGTAERALILIDKQGNIRFTHVSDINIRPDLGMIARALKDLDTP